MTRIKILYIIKSGDFGGVQSHLINLIEHLDHALFDITVCLPSGPVARRLKALHVRLIYLDFIRYTINLFSDISSFFKLLGIIKSGNYVIVHAHSSKPGLFGRLAAKILGVPIIIYTPHLFHFRDSFHFLKKKSFMLLETWLSRVVTDMVISVSDHARRLAIQNKIINKDKIVTIANGINPLPFERQGNSVRRRKRNEFGISDKAVVIGMVARLMPQKAPEDFLQAAARVLDKYENNVCFILVGKGNLKQQIQDLQKELNLARYLYLTGSRDDVPELLNMFDLFVITSLWEGLPITILEAMACSLPVIASDIPGNNEIVMHGETGFLYPKGDIEALSEKIIKLVDDPVARATMGKLGKMRFEEHFLASQMAKRTEKLYLELLQKKIILKIRVL